MRAITVRQPWAWAIVHGGKDVENRSRNVAGSYRGPVAIHAGLTYDVGAYASSAWPPNARTAREGKRVRGAIIGVVDLVEVHHGDCLTIETYREGLEQQIGTCSPWAQAERHHLVVANPRPLRDPIPYRGALGLWTPSADVVAAIEAQLAEVLPAP